MLKLLKPTNIFPASPTKCGEIFYCNSDDLTIFCTLCQMKSFYFDDFLQHLHNVHLENHLDHAEVTETKEFNEYLEENVSNEAEDTKTKEFNEYLEANVSNEAELCETEDVLEISVVQCFDRSELDTESYSEEEEDEFVIVEKPKKKRDFKSDSQDVINEATADEFEIQFKPSQHKDENSASKSEKSSKPLQFSCPECQEIFFRKKDMDSHVIEIHNGYKCSLCDTRFQYRHHLRRHEQKHDPELKFPCPIAGCKKIYIDHDSLKRHILKHNPEQNFPCPIPECNKIYSISRHLEKHIAQHKKSNVAFKRFVCDICGYSCSSTAVLTVHQRRHTGEKPFPCEFCEKCFVSKTALTTHMAMHSTTRSHVCEICHASFLRIDIMRRHKLIHSEEKRFKCKFCDKAFKQPQGLDGHMRRLHKDPKAKTDEKLPFL